MAAHSAGLTLSVDALDQLMPLHLLISPTCHISRVGPTLSKLRPDMDFVGQRFLEVFELRRPRTDIKGFHDLSTIVGSKLRLQFRSGSPTLLKGLLVNMPGQEGLILSLSFGISVVDAVQKYSLTNSDFAPTDLAVEMLYLVEAKNAVMVESRNLNARLRKARIAAEKQAATDMLTGLNNRRAMDEQLQGLSSSGTEFGLMHLDLDFFKEVNDTHGHAAGDYVLRETARILAEEIRDADTVARVGGDEFVLIFDRLTDEAQLMKIAERIVKRLEEPVIFEEHTCRISGSIGVTTTRFYETADPDRMLSDADVALYNSKHRGRARATMVSQELLRAAMG